MWFCFLFHCWHKISSYTRVKSKISLSLIKNSWVQHEMFTSSPFLRVGPKIFWACVTEVSIGYTAWRYTQLTSYCSGVLTKLSTLSSVRIKFISPNQIYKNWATKFSVHITTTMYQLQTWCLIQNPLHIICGKTSIFLTVLDEACISYCSSTLCYLFGNVLIIQRDFHYRLCKN